MSRRDDLERAVSESRAQVDMAREALAASRASRSGGGAKNVRQAEDQLHALRAAVSDDARALRDRLVQLDPGTRRGAALAATAGVGTLVALVGSGFAVRGRIRRGVARRGVERQALAIARALAGEAAQSFGPTSSTARGSAPRRGRTLVPIVAIGAAIAGAALLRERRSPVHDADLWLPEEHTGPL